MKKLIATSLITTLLSVSFSFAQSHKRPPLPPELKEGLDKIKEAVEAKEITPEEAKKKHDELVREFQNNREELHIDKRPDLGDDKKPQKPPRPNKPQRPQKPELDDDIKDQINELKKLEKSIHAEIKAKVDELGKEASREEIKKAVESFKEANKDRFDALKEAHSAIRESLEANKPEKPVRPELPDELKEEVKNLHSLRKEMHEKQKELHKNLKDASKEEREELITIFKEENKEKHQAIKEQAKKVKTQIRELTQDEATRKTDL